MFGGRTPQLQPMRYTASVLHCWHPVILRIAGLQSANVCYECPMGVQCTAFSEHILLWKIPLPQNYGALWNDFYKLFLLVS